MQAVAQDFDFAMRASGAADQMMGRTTSEKRTLGEVQRVGHEGSMRMAHLAMMFDVQGIRPTALRWCANRQQYTELEQYVRIAGDDALEFGGDRVRIRPEDLRGSYDYLPKTGPEPPDPGQLAMVMEKMLATLAKSPEVLAMPDSKGRLLDLHAIIQETYRQFGIKNIGDFYKEPQPAPGMPGMPPGPAQVLPDEQIQKGVQAGNYTPLQ